MNGFTDYAAYIEAAMQSWHIPGAAVVVVRGDEVLHQGAYGLRDVEEKLPVMMDTRFAMASVTKSFAAMAVALLVDDGKLEWDQPIREVMPEFILKDPYVTTHITVRDMLSHRTGLPRHDLSVWRSDITLAELIKRMRHHEFSASFREKFQYNNLMYYATGYLIERVTGQPWADFIQARIFDALGMTASNFVPEAPRDGQHTAFGYRVERDEAGAATGLKRMPYGLHTSVSPGTAGALFSTPADLLQWLRVQVNDGRAGDVQLVSPTNLKQMHLPHTIIPAGGMGEALFGTTISTYGLGWFVEPYRGHTVVQHGGNVEGFSLMIGFVPGERVGVVVLTNIAGLPLRDALLYESIDRALGLPPQDWNAKYHAVFDPMIIGQAQNKQTSADERIADAPPSHPLAAYTGTFEADGYPDFAVRMADDGTLQACTVGSLGWSTLRHYHYDVFEWELTDFDLWIKIRFQIDNTGELESVAVPLEPMVNPIIYKRKPVVLPPALLDAVAGQYATDIEGMGFTVTPRDGKLYIAPTGGTAEEARPYKLDATTVGLRVNNTRFDFAREADDTITAVLVKDGYMTLAARRQA